MLINCVAYENGVRLAELTVDEISDYHERTECIVWVALMDATTDELDKMKEEPRHSARRVCTEGGILPDS